MQEPGMEMRMHDPAEDVTKTPEEMAAEIGCAVHELAEKLVEATTKVKKDIEVITEKLTPIPLTRRERRARKFNHSRLYG